MKSRELASTPNNNQNNGFSFFKSVFALFPFFPHSSKQEKLEKLDAAIAESNKRIEAASVIAELSAESDRRVAHSIEKADRALAEMYSARTLQKF